MKDRGENWRFLTCCGRLVPLSLETHATHSINAKIPTLFFANVGRENVTRSLKHIPGEVGEVWTAPQEAVLITRAPPLSPVPYLMSPSRIPNPSSYPLPRLDLSETNNPHGKTKSTSFRLEMYLDDGSNWTRRFSCLREISSLKWVVLVSPKANPDNAAQVGEMRTNPEPRSPHLSHLIT